MTTINGLHLRRAMGRADWGVPDPFGPDGWRMLERTGDGAIIVTVADHPGDGNPWAPGPQEWVHASMSRRDRVPSYDDLCALHRAVFGDGWAYQVFAPPTDHVNIHPNTLHLWGLVSGEPVLPNFGEMGTI